MRDLYTASEKTELLRKIAEVKTYNTVSEREKDIVKNEFAPHGFVDVYSYSGKIMAVCSITDKGRLFLANDGYIKQEQEERERVNIEILAKENVRLTNKKLKYEIRTRWIAAISLFVSVASLTLNLCPYSNSPGNPSKHPFDSLSTNSENQRQYDTTDVSPECTHRKVHFQCYQSRDAKYILQYETMLNR